MNRFVLKQHDADMDFIEWREGSGGTIEIFEIQVNSKRRSGIGRKMLETWFKSLPQATRVWAITRIENEVAQQFYEACGFSCSGVLRRFYRNEHQADAVLYVRSAGGPI